MTDDEKVMESIRNREYRVQLESCLYEKSTAQHRDTKLIGLCDNFVFGENVVNNTRCLINGIQVAIFHLPDFTWVIGPIHYSSEALMDDLGPFPTLEEALIVLRLTMVIK